MVYDTILVGLGPASISCAIYLKRFNYSVLLVGTKNSSLSKTEYIDNYYGISHIAGKDLIDAGIKQAEDLNIDIKYEEVTSIEGIGPFTVNTSESSYEGKTVFLGVGKARNKLNIKGASTFEGKGISYCAICDGFFYRKKKLALIGAGAFMESELNVLKRFTNDILIFTNGEKIQNESLDVIKSKIIEFTGDERLKTIKTEDGKSYDVDGCFVALGSASSVSFAKHLGLVLDDDENLVVKDYQTNVKGIYAGGDCIKGLKQVVKAACDGAEAAMEINKSLKQMKK